MADKDYYRVLGLDDDASQEQIKSAYRERAKCLHPDHYDGGSGPFRELREAFEVLGDPDRRRAYDATCQSPPRRRSASLEPLIPRRPAPRPSEPSRSPVEPLDALGASLRSMDSAFQRWFDRFVGRIDRLGQVVPVEVTISRAEAQAGGRVRVPVPVQQRCPACRGRGHDGVFACPRCRGVGQVASSIPVWLALPAGIRNGDVFRVALDAAGLPGTALRLRVTVSG